MLARRDADLTRLREIRDQQIAELNERKQKDAVKLNSLDEYRRLVRSQTVRLFTIRSYQILICIITCRSVSRRSSLSSNGTRHSSPLTQGMRT